MNKKIFLASSIATLSLAGMLSFNNNASALELTKDKTLTENVTECYTIPSNKNVTIDLAGYDITCNSGNAIEVKDGAALTIKGTGNVKAEGSESAAIYNNIGGTTTIESGKFESANWYTIKNLGTITINGGTFSQGDGITSNASLIANGWYDSASNTGASDQGNAHTDSKTANLTINSGKFIHKNTTSTIKSDDYSKTTINGGEFTSQNGFLIQATGDVTVNGGDFNGFKSMVILYGDGSEAYPGKAAINGGTADMNNGYVAAAAWEGGTLEIADGEFTGLTGILDETYGDSSKAQITISGGSFDSDPNSYIASGSAIHNNNGTFEVAKTAEISGLESNQHISMIAKDELSDTEQTEMNQIEELEGFQTLGILEITLTESGVEKTSSEDPLTFTQTIPEENRTPAEGYDRTWRVVRFHEGEAEIIDSAYDKESGKLTFSTDKFSTYVIGYTDTETPKAPDTGLNTKDFSNTTLNLIFSILTGIAISLAAFIVKSARKH